MISVLHSSALHSILTFKIDIISLCKIKHSISFGCFYVNLFTFRCDKVYGVWTGNEMILVKCLYKYNLYLSFTHRLGKHHFYHGIMLMKEKEFICKHAKQNKTKEPEKRSLLPAFFIYIFFTYRGK
jgi:hypothetical protein